MFVVVYRWKLRPGLEAEFRAAWRELSNLYIQLRGQHDATLVEGDDGVWVGKAVWPDRETYVLALERGVPDPQVANRMNAAVAERLDPDFRFIEGT